jgi:hypothetical protein
VDLVSAKNQMINPFKTDQVEFSSNDSQEHVSEQEYADGEYCASVDYYNPNTGHRPLMI